MELKFMNPSRRRINGIGINGMYGTFSATSYRESLLLLDHTSSIIYRDGVRSYTLQQLPFSPATKPGYPGRFVAGDAFPGRHVAQDKSNGKARREYVPERLTRAT
ncbi:hypothetical protein Tco_0202206, partial [Tanacetum coccineum]